MALTFSRILVSGCTTMLLVGCGVLAPPAPPAVHPAATVPLLEVRSLLQDGWEHLDLKGRTHYEIVAVEGRMALRATGERSASGLIRFVASRPAECPFLVWSWRVSELQPSADLRYKQSEDVAASLFILFGDPGFLAAPDPVPTLRYVWSNDHARIGDIIDSPYLPGIVKSIVVQAGEHNLRRWIVETRNVLTDYEAAFGHPPEQNVHAVALFTDNDQTGEPVVSYYEWARFDCRHE